MIRLAKPQGEIHSYLIITIQRKVEDILSLAKSISVLKQISRLRFEPMLAILRQLCNLLQIVFLEMLEKELRQNPMPQFL